MDLFQANQSEQDTPLAYRMRPANLDQYIGQSHIVGPGRLLRRVIQADRLSSLIFYGPPGCGKTALARLIAGTTKSFFDSLNAVLSGVKELRSSIAEARERKELYGRRTILFVDEVHRWNKSQQDALLPWVENGTVILIGATTENPFFEVNSALVSRSRIFQLKPLSDQDLLGIARQALQDRDRGYGKWKVHFQEGALEHLIEVASGDARTLLNALELAVETSVSPFPPPEGVELFVSLEAAEESIQQKVVLYDKEGDYHFDAASAFIKSIRGSDPDAALYWMARMVRAGEDPRFIFRRMLISACEDIGLADPQALVITEAAAAAFERVGMPEGRYHLTHAALYLATAPKSNSALAFFDALKAVEENVRTEVPNHLRDASRDKEGFGHGEGYLYPHAYRDHWVGQNYLPAQMRGKLFYQPGTMGYEGSIRDDIARRREAQLQLIESEEGGEVLTFSPLKDQDKRWLRRAGGGSSKKVESIREKLFSLASLRRHELVLVPPGTGSFLIWEASRRVPEGGVWAEVETPNDADPILEYGKFLSPDIRPSVIIRQNGTEASSLPEELRFEAIIGYNSLFRCTPQELARQSHRFAGLLAPSGRMVTAEIIPAEGMKLSELILERAQQSSAEKELTILRDAEGEIYGTGGSGEAEGIFRSPETIAQAFSAAGLQVGELERLEFLEDRTITGREIERWFSPDRTNSYGSFIHRNYPGEQEQIISFCSGILQNSTVRWRQVIAFLRAVKI